MLEHVQALVCQRCEESFRPSRRARCPQCADGGALRFVYRTALLAPFDRAVWARREPWLWRYRELLPFDDDLVPPPLQIGQTPLYGSPRLASRCGVRGLFVKDESRNPTGRTADRAAALLSAEALRGEAALVSGPLAPSVAAFAASAQQNAIALIDDEREANFVAQFGAEPLLLPKNLERGDALLRLHADGFFLADAPNPLAFEGLRTLGLELGDQLAERLPDWIAIDARQPDLIDAVAAGLAQCQELGLFSRAPQLLAVGGPGGDAQVAIDPAELADFAEAARGALGLPIPPEGATGLAGLSRGVKERIVPADALALVVVEAPPPSSLALNKLQPLPDYERLRAAVRRAAER